jgi:hypothetical protein
MKTSLRERWQEVAEEIAYSPQRLQTSFKSSFSLSSVIFSSMRSSKIYFYEQRRNKTIISTMKTSLRERWQEVAEEIERTKIPEIHLLTVDEDIPKNKAQCLGISFKETFVISPYTASPPKFSLYVSVEYLSHSLVKTHLTPCLDTFSYLKKSHQF